MVVIELDCYLSAATPTPENHPEKRGDSGDAQLKPCRIMHLSNFAVADVQVI